LVDVAKAVEIRRLEVDHVAAAANRRGLINVDVSQGDVRDTDTHSVLAGPHCILRRYAPKRTGPWTGARVGIELESHQLAVLGNDAEAGRDPVVRRLGAKINHVVAIAGV